MSKKQILDELTTMLAVSLRHKIGSIVNNESLYAQKYANDAETLFMQAEKIKQQANWNSNDKKLIREILKKKLKKELDDKSFLSDKKYEYIDSEIDKTLNSMNLNV